MRRLSIFHPGVPDRVSTSQTLDATFLSPERHCIHRPAGKSRLLAMVRFLLKEGKPGRTMGLYTTADGILVLSGSPRVFRGAAW